MTKAKASEKVTGPTTVTVVAGATVQLDPGTAHVLKLANTGTVDLVIRQPGGSGIRTVNSDDGTIDYGGQTLGAGSSTQIGPTWAIPVTATNNTGSAGSVQVTAFAMSDRVA